MSGGPEVVPTARPARGRRGQALVAGSVSLALVAGLVVAIRVLRPDEPEHLPAQVEELDSHGGEVRGQAWEQEGQTPVDVPDPSWPAGGAARARLSGSAEVQVGDLPVWVARPSHSRLAEVSVEVLDREATPGAWRDALLLRVAGGQMAGAARLSVGYDGFRYAYGAGWAERLRLWSVPSCALSTPETAECAATPLPSENLTETGRVRGEVALPAAGTAIVLAVAAEASGSSGNFAATSLSASASWTSGGGSGDFAWSYPMRTPPALGGPEPNLTLSYSSSSVDGRSEATNNQPSWIGEGFEYWPGYIERRYVQCADDMKAVNNQQPNNSTKTGDLCWRSDNATMSLNGSATELVWQDGKGWHARNEDAAKIEKLTGGSNGDNNGEYWKVTTADGIQYFFGRNSLPGQSGTTDSAWTVPVYGNHPGEPCRASSFADSDCAQAWRWNLDYVVDPRGNTQSYWYGKELNQYAARVTDSSTEQYVRGGYLKRIDYGTWDRGAADRSLNPTAKIVFDTADRCLSSSCGTHNAENWPDTPWDQHCAPGAGSCAGKYAPTFWTTQRLAAITTWVWDTSKSPAGWQDVDSWTFTHSFPSPGDGTNAGLWLASIQQRGLVGDGDVVLPPVTFQPVAMPNRVLTQHNTTNNWQRIANIVTETGAKIQVNYSLPECTASNVPDDDQTHTNTMRCYPVITPDPHATDDSLITEWWHKYVVTQVSETDIQLTDGHQSPTRNTYYFYEGTPAWHYADDDGLTNPKYKTWNQFRGYATVITKVGDDPTQQTLTKTTFLRGMHGDRAAPGGGTRTVTVGASIGSETVYDEDVFAGMVREKVTYNGVESKPVSKTVNVPWQSPATASRTINGDTVTARFVDVQTIYQATALGTDGQSGWRTSRTHTTFDTTYGTVVTTQNDGDIVVSGDETCVRTSYNRNSGLNIVRLPKQVTTTALPCGTAPTTADHMVSDVRTSYDGAASPDTAPTYGSPSRVEQLKDWTASGGTVFQTVSQATFDAFGRPGSSTDVRGNTTTIAYTPATGGPVTQITETTAAPYRWTTIKDIAVYWGSSTKVVDPNGRVTQAAYDALGRVAKVWEPGWSRDGHEEMPSAEYSYIYSPTRSDYPYLTTRTLNAAGGYNTSFQIFDGLLRPVQTQAAAIGGGRVITDTRFDAWGRPAVTYRAHAEPGAPSGALWWEPEWSLPAVNKTIFDRTGRPTAEVFLAGDGVTNLVEQWRTTTAYAGDRTLVTPPTGGVATTMITDIDGRTVELRQHTTASGVAGAYQSTFYTYDRKGDLTKVTDPAGNEWAYTFDLKGRLIQSRDPDKGQTTIAYNDYDDVVSTTDARGEVLVRQYDQLGRRTGLYDDSIATANRRAEWRYDLTAGGKTVRGQLTHTLRYDGANTYQAAVSDFTARYQPTGTVFVIPSAETGLAGSFTIGYGYSEYDGSPTSVTYPAMAGIGAEKVTTVYDPLSGLASRLDTNLTGVDSYVIGQQYSSYGEPTLTTLKTTGGRYVEDATYYDQATRWISRQAVKPESATGTVTDRGYGYDNVGNITSIVDTPGAGPADRQCFRYDALRRLTSAWTPSAETGCQAAPNVNSLGGPAPYWTDWTFDSIGNRRSEARRGVAGTTTLTYKVPDPGRNALRPHAVTDVTTELPNQTATTVSYGYDETGNTIGRPGQSLTWDSEGRLRTVTQDGATIATNIYDADGTRLIRRDATGKTLYLPGIELRYETATAAKALTRYYEFDGQPVASRTGGTANQNLTWLFSDHQGTQQTAVNAADQTVSIRRQTPYGAPRGSQPTWPNQKSFVGGDLDPTGLIHLGAREYDAVLGRFISVDPIQDLTDPQQWNGYAYANNNPTTFSDPSGLKACSDDVCGPGADYVDGAGNYHSVPGHNDGCGGCSGSHDPTASDPPSVRKLGKGGGGGGGGGGGHSAGGTDPATAAKLAAEEAKRRAKEAIVKAALALGKVALDELGITDALNCFTQGDLGACMETAINVATSFVGGLIAKFARKYGAPWKWDDAVRLGSKVKNLLGDLISGVKRYFSASSCAGNSFAAGTLVLLADGSAKPIEEIVNGDEVLATDPEAGRTEAKEVTATITGSGTKHLVEITVDTDGTAGDQTGTIVATDGHPFWVPGVGTWLDATDLQPGLSLLTAAGAWVQISGIKRWTQTSTVYNLTVFGIHTYYTIAGSAPVLVHNTGGACSIAGHTGAAVPFPRPDGCTCPVKIVLGPDGKARPGGRQEVRATTGQDERIRQEREQAESSTQAFAKAAKQADDNPAGAWALAAAWGAAGIKRGWNKARDWLRQKFG